MNLENFEYSNSQSTPESWAQFSHDNIEKAEQERVASINLRALINNVINDISNDVMSQANVVDEAFRKRIAELERAKSQLEDELKKV